MSKVVTIGSVRNPAEALAEVRDEIPEGSAVIVAWFRDGRMQWRSYGATASEAVWMAAQIQHDAVSQGIEAAAHDGEPRAS